VRDDNRDVVAYPRGVRFVTTVVLAGILGAVAQQLASCVPGELVLDTGDGGKGGSGDANASSDSPVRDSPAGDAPLDADSGPPQHGSGGFTLPCGDSTCTGPAKECCIDWSADAYACVSTGPGSSGGPGCPGSDTTQVQCKSDADCPDEEECCGTKVVAGDRYSLVRCVPSCTGTGTGTDHFCHILAQCSPGESCEPTPLLPGYSICEMPTTPEEAGAMDAHAVEAATK
jgi:hypothetical protein